MTSTATEREKAKLASEADPPHPADDKSGEQRVFEPEKKTKPKCKNIGGSKSDTFNLAIARATLDAFWITNQDAGDKAAHVMAAALKGIAPKNELEGMLAGQLVAAHQASMECFRRAMLPDQTIESRAMNLSAANKSSRTYASLLDALNRSRGKGGQQRVIVEHVHVHEGGQAIVGSVQHGRTGGRGNRKSRGQPHAKAAAISHAPVAPLWSADEEREPLPVSGDAERAMPHARRP